MAWIRDEKGYVNDEGFHIYKTTDPDTGKSGWGVYNLSDVKIGDSHPTLKAAKASVDEG